MLNTKYVQDTDKELLRNSLEDLELGTAEIFNASYVAYAFLQSHERYSARDEYLYQSQLNACFENVRALSLVEFSNNLQRDCHCQSTRFHYSHFMKTVQAYLFSFKNTVKRIS